MLTGATRCRARSTSTPRKAPDGTIGEFIDYVLSPEGQSVVTEVGYFPVQ